METPELLKQLGLAVLLGALVGLERQRDQPGLAGFRTFPLITAVGTLLGSLSHTFGGSVLAVGLLALAALCALGRRKTDSGITTEVAVLVMFSIGAYITVGSYLVAVAAGCGTAVLLQFKPQLHGFVSKLGDEDVHALMRFVLIAGIILPLLPDKSLGSFEVLNPYQIGLMVVIVVAINLTGYVLYRFVGKTAGTLLAGALGGVISSTATTMSEAKRAKHAGRAALVILIASTVAFVRVVVEIAILFPAFLGESAPRLLILAAASTILCGIAWFLWHEETGANPNTETPGELKAALIFGGMYALIGTGIALANRHLGKDSLHWVAALSGLTDVDAITLSTTQLVRGKALDAAAGAKMILIASLTNLIFKGGIVAVTGSRELRRKIALLFGILLAVGGVILVVK